MKDDITKGTNLQVDIATGKELPGAELVIKDKDGNTVAQWVSKDKPHYIEKLPSGDYTLSRDHPPPMAISLRKALPLLCCPPVSFRLSL